MSNFHLRKIDIIVYALCLAAVIGMFVYAAATRSTLPEQIPTHYSLTGKINGYGGRSSVFMMPVVLLVLLPTLIITGMIPAAWNLPGVKVTKANAPYITACVRNMMDSMLLTITATMTTFFVCQVRNTNVPIFVLPLMLVLFLVNIIYCIVQTRRISRNTPADPE